MRNPHAITMADMKTMADTQAAPLLQKLKSDPNNVTLLCEVAATYHIAHQFHDAAAYYGKAEELQPGNVVIRTKLASSLFRDGDADGAIAQLNEALKTEPGNANALYDLGIIRLQGKGDGRGAVAAWQQLLKANPQLSADRRAVVSKLMADVLTSLNEQTEGARSDGKRKSNIE
jgi:cytochrome c-type biogenesis protein CcmH/NrfG